MLEKATGLQINKKKTKIITFRVTAMGDKDRLTQIGQIVDNFKHLGVYIAKNKESSTRKTYRMAVESLKNATRKFITTGQRGLESNLLHKKTVFNSIVNSRIRHVYRTMVPSSTDVKDIEEQTFKSLWKKTYDNIEYGRTKIARSSLQAPIEKGGLGLPEPTDSIFQAQMSSCLATLRHAILHPETILNRMYDLDEATKPAIFSGSKAIKLRAQLLKHLGPTSDQTMLKLTELMVFNESKEGEWRNIPLAASKYENFFTKLSNLQELWVEGLYTLGNCYVTVKDRSTGIRRIEINHILEDKFTAATRTRIENLRKLVFKDKKIGVISKPTQFGCLPFLLRSTLQDKRHLTMEHKESIKAKFKNTPLRAYQTRIRDKQEVPRDEKIFMESYKRIIYSPLTKIQINKHMEAMLRVLPSKNKMMKMKLTDFEGYDGTNRCAICPAISNSQHQLSECLFPTFCLHALNSLDTWATRGIRNINAIHLEFHTPLGNTTPPEIRWQVDALFLEIKQISFNLWKTRNFYNMSNQRMFIHLVRAVQNTIMIIIRTRTKKIETGFLHATLRDLTDNEAHITELYTRTFDHLPLGSIE